MATALLVVDVQRDLVDGLPAPRRRAFVETVRSLVADARGAGVAVIYVRHDGGADELTPQTPGWQIAAEIGPLEGDPIVEKRFRDAFRETNLAGVLADRGIDHIVVAGMQSEFCIDSTIREAERRGYRVTLVEDGHATFPAEGESEDDIRRHVNRVVRWEIATLVPAAAVFATAET
jgi:nicotinamidase-related amidase